MTWGPLVYEDATLILPHATVEFRQSLDQRSIGITDGVCEATFLTPDVTRIWGELVGHRSHLLVATGKSSSAIWG